tara:strand:+ start:76 stop:885 length:810 start_codon:yes stop_codon:yes gene_type:complete
MAHGGQDESTIRGNARTGVISRQEGIDMLSHLFQTQGAVNPESNARIFIDQDIQQGIADGTLDSDGNPIGGDAGPGGGEGGAGGPGSGGGGGGFTEDEIAAAEALLAGTRAGRQNIFERVQAQSPFINPLLGDIRAAGFNPLSAAGALTAAGDPTQAFDFRSFIANQQPGTFNRVGGFGSFGTGGQVGTGLLGNIQGLFDPNLTDPTVNQVAARNFLESQAGSLLPTIAAAGLNPIFQPAARAEAQRRIRTLNPLQNPFEAFASGQLAF